MDPHSTSPISAPTTERTNAPAFLYIAGIGAVGSALLEQIDDLSTTPVRVVGACTSTRALWVTDGHSRRTLPLDGADGETLDWASVTRTLAHESPRPLIFVDATGSSEVADLYERLFRAGIHVVTPSKIANTRSQETFDRLRAVAAANGVAYRYETTVGAGLPVVQTVSDLVNTGDTLRCIRGAVSGTLTFLFDELRRGYSFSQAVRRAIDRGYAEPDVRDDLSGTDVARKFLILARSAGCSIYRDEIEIESLVPEALRNRPYQSFLNALPAVDERWRKKSRVAADDDKILQYVGRFEDGHVDVGVRAVDADTPFGRLDARENLFEFTTDRYAEQPLTVRGPGAGPRVTAAGVLADVIKVARRATLDPSTPPS